MMKKTIFFMLCMSPLAVNAEIIKIPENDMFGAGPTYTMDGLTATDDTYVFTSGTSIQAGSGGITATGDFYVGRDSSDPVTGGYIYLTSGVSDLFNVRSDGDISIGGSLVLDTGLYIGETTGGGDAISLVSIYNPRRNRSPKEERFLCGFLIIRVNYYSFSTFKD